MLPLITLHLHVVTMQYAYHNPVSLQRVLPSSVQLVKLPLIIIMLSLCIRLPQILFTQPFITRSQVTIILCHHGVQRYQEQYNMHVFRPASGNPQDCLPNNHYTLYQSIVLKSVPSVSADDYYSSCSIPIIAQPCVTTKVTMQHSTGVTKQCTADHDTTHLIPCHHGNSSLWQEV